MTFGSRLKELRLKNNMTQRELSEKLFITRQAVTKWENDKSIPEGQTLNKLAEILNVSPSYLLSGEEPLKIEKAKKKHSRFKLSFLIGFLIVIVIVLITIPLGLSLAKEKPSLNEDNFCGAYISFDEEYLINDPKELYNVDLPYFLNSDYRYFFENTLIVPENEFDCFYVYFISKNANNKYIITKGGRYDLLDGLKEYNIDCYCNFTIKEMIPLKSVKINYIDIKHDSITEEIIYLNDKGKLTSSLGRLIDSYKLDLVQSNLTASYTVEALDIYGGIKRYNIYQTMEILLYIKDPNKPFIKNTGYKVRFVI